MLLPVEDWALREPWWPRPVLDDLTRSWRGGRSLYDLVRSELLDWCAAREQSPAEPISVHIGGFHLAPPPRAVRLVDEAEGRWRAYTPLSHWLESVPRPARGTARIATAVHVLGVHVEDGRAAGAVVVDAASGARRTIRASTVVLAAGTLESTRLAIQALSDTGNLPQPALTGLVDHIVQGFNVTLAQRSVPDELLGRTRQGFFWFAPAGEDSRSNVFVEGTFGPEGHLGLEVWVTGEQTRSDAGVVSCDPGDPWPWPVSVRTGLAPEDARVVRAQRDELQRFWDDLCAELGRPRSALDFEQDFTSPTRTLRWMRAQLRRDSYRRCYADPVTWSSPLGTEDHEGGTLPLGDVLDDRHEFIDVPGLFAAGPASFPRHGAANPSLTILALARRLAGVLAA